tara:strand:- start:542 stop:2947 length:2406 start_codon:yes stop_codon:yes gene_type:complete
MALENLKSIFASVNDSTYAPARQGNSTIKKTYDNTPVLSKIPKLPEITIDNSALENAYDKNMIDGLEANFGVIGGAVDFIDSSVPGFTTNFNTPGNTLPDGEPGNSKFLGVPTVYDTRTIDVDVESLVGQKLGYGDYATPDFQNLINRLTIAGGLTFTDAKVKIQLSTEGVQTSLFYHTSPLGTTLGVSGAINKFGEMGEKIKDASIPTPFGEVSLGLKLPNIPFAAAVKDLNPLAKLTYPNTVYELTSGNLLDVHAPGKTPLDLGSLNGATDAGIAALVGAPNSTRGVVFQVLGHTNQAGLTPNFDYQGVVKNAIDLQFRNPIEILKPGKIEFKQEFKDKITGTKEGIIGLFDKTKNKIKIKSENKEVAKKKDGLLAGLLGWGKRIKFPQVKKKEEIDDGKATWLQTFAMDAKSLGRKTLNFIDEHNPIEDLTLPKIKLHNPFNIGITDFGGQAKFKQNQPRALDHNIPIVVEPPSKQGRGDRRYRTNVQSTPYSGIGLKNKYSAGELDFYPARLANKTGDLQTLKKINGVQPNISEKNGMPFYFKDLRDGSYVSFRGYIDGLNENVNPSWNSQKYIGRSEPVWAYEGTSGRDVSFNLKLYAGTAAELDAIYAKVQRLTSFCYPEYKQDAKLITSTAPSADPTGKEIQIGKTRMKPPLLEMRLGELYGGQAFEKGVMPTATAVHAGTAKLANQTRRDVLGFIKTLSYTFPDGNSWEWRYGQRVPKLIQVAISYQIIHQSVPDMDTLFYGYSSTDLINDFEQRNSKYNELAEQEKAMQLQQASTFIDDSSSSELVETATVL